MSPCSHSTTAAFASTTARRIEPTVRSTSVRAPPWMAVTMVRTMVEKSCVVMLAIALPGHIETERLRRVGRRIDVDDRAHQPVLDLLHVDLRLGRLGHGILEQDLAADERSDLRNIPHAAHDARQPGPVVLMP